MDPTFKKICLSPSSATHPAKKMSRNISYNLWGFSLALETSPFPAPAAVVHPVPLKL